MKIYIPRNWIKKFKNDDDQGSTIPIAPIVLTGTTDPKRCHCGTVAIPGLDWCEECVDGYYGEDEP
jgi:hypothetical protein